MFGRGPALAVAVGLAGLCAPAAAQDPPAARLSPSAFLLPPVAPPGQGRDLPPPADKGGDPEPRPRPIPPVRDDRPADPEPPRPRAARLTVAADVTPAGAEVADRADRPAPRQPLRGDELFDYLSDGRLPRRADDGLLRSSDKIGDKVKDVIDDKTHKGFFRSDHAFDGFVSPVTNPFLFEDPRSLTEVRPVFIYQKIPSPQPNFAGGNIYFIGTQARLALGNRFSIVVNKLGGEAVNSSAASPFGDHFGLAELWLGPKVTFYRNEDAGSVLAGGATFQIPLGSASVYQDTGKLSILPYLSYAQRLARIGKFGTFNGLASAGYSFSTDKQRSDYFYVSGHVDFDVADRQRFYPLVEVNWLQYTTNGTARAVAGEGRDLINFGGIAKGSSLVTWAVGGRVKLTRGIELGAAYEMPLVGNRDFFQNRFTVDLIWRY